MMPADCVTSLHEINDRLRRALIRLRPERRRSTSIEPQEFSGILDQLLRAAECLRSAPADASMAGALAREARDYEANLFALKQFLPALHVQLLAEKSRLETSRSHLTSAAAWAGTAKKTL